MERGFSPKIGFTALLVLCALAGCTKPKERTKGVDRHLRRAYELAGTDAEGALVELAKAKTATPAQSAYVKGMVLEGEHDSKAAIAEYERAIRLDSKAFAPRTALARVLILAGRPDEARTHLRYVLKGDPADLAAQLLFAVIAQTPEQRQVAAVSLRAWPSQRPTTEKQTPLRAEYFLCLAQVLDNRKASQEAVQSGRDADIGSVDAALTLAKFAALAKQDRLAALLIQKLAQADASPARLQEIASFALRLGDVKSAGHALKRIPGQTRSPALSLLKGKFELASGHPDKAVTHTQSALAGMKEGSKATKDKAEHLLARALLAAEQKNESKKVLASLLKRSPLHRGGHFLSAQIEITEGKPTDAAARLSALSEKFPDDVALLWRLARAHVHGSGFAEAETIYRRISELSPKDGRAPAHVAEMLHRQGKRDAALEFWQSQVKKNAQALAPLRGLATQLIRMGRGEEAASTIENSEAGETDPIGLGLLLADVHSTRKRPLRVTATLEALSQTHPKSARVWSALARDQGNREDFVAMEKSLRTVLSLEPRALKDKARLATVLSRVGKKEEAVRLFEELSEAAQGDIVALNNAAMLYATELDDPERAVGLAERAHELAPENQSIVDTLAWSLWARNKPNDLQRAEKLLRVSGAAEGSAETKYHYAAILLRLKKEGGRALLAQALAEPGDEAWRQKAQELLSTSRP